MILEIDDTKKIYNNNRYYKLSNKNRNNSNHNKNSQQTRTLNARFNLILNERKLQILFVIQHFKPTKPN